MWRVVVCDQETSYARGLQNAYPQWVVAPVETDKQTHYINSLYLSHVSYYLSSANSMCYVE